MGVSTVNDTSIRSFLRTFFQTQLQRSDLHPDAWDPIIVRDPQDTREQLAKVVATNTATPI